MDQKKRISLFIITAIAIILIIVIAVTMNNKKDNNILETNHLNNTVEVNEVAAGPQDPIDELPTEPVETQTAQ